MKLAYVTSNDKKFEEAFHIFSKYDLPLHLYRSSLLLTEIQGSLEEIARHKAQEAWDRLQVPLVVEDISFHCDAIGGMPGPYIRFFLESIGETGLWEMIQPYNNSSCRVICTIGYIDRANSLSIFQGKLEGNVVSPKGFTHHGVHSWNCIFQPQGFHKTFGELSLEEISHYSARKKALENLITFLKQNPLQ